VIVYFFRDIVGELAGKQTSSDIKFTLAGLDFSGEGLKPNEIVAYVVSAVSVIYGLLQKRLRKNTIEKMHVRTEILERTVDPKRSSSNLTTRGDTRPEDA